MINPFVKFKGLEFFGAYEMTSGKIASEPETRSYTEIYGELVYRLGSREQYYIGGRYNTLSGELKNFNPNADAEQINISRFAIAAGWYMTPNVMIKAEYVNQDYNDFAADGAAPIYSDGNFNGAVIEATISF